MTVPIPILIALLVAVFVVYSVLLVKLARFIVENRRRGVCPSPDGPLPIPTDAELRKAREIHAPTETD